MITILLDDLTILLDEKSCLTTTKRASLCLTTLSRRGMIGDRPIGSLLRSGKRDGYVISQCIFLLSDFDNTDVDNLTLGTDNYQLFASFCVNSLNSLMYLYQLFASFCVNSLNSLRT
jgi:hypothetical protein